METRTRSLALGALLLLACGPAEPPRSAERVDALRSRPRPGELYEVLHRETLRVGTAAPRITETRTLVRVEDEHPDGSRSLRARVTREGTDAIDAVVRLTLSPVGELVGEPEPECGAPPPRLGAYLRHVFGARALATDDVSEGSRWRADYLSDAIERPARATFRVDEIGADALRGRLASRVQLEDGALGPVRVTGSGRVRGRFQVSRRDGFAGRTDLRTELRGSFVDEAGRSTQGTLRTRSQLLIRLAEGRGERFATECAAPAFDPEAAAALIRRHAGPVQLCYQNLAQHSPDLHGRVLVRFTIGPDGGLHDARVAEDGVGSDALAACILDTLGRIRIDPAPPRDVSVAYPFVFAPQP